MGNRDPTRCPPAADLALHLPSWFKSKTKLHLIFLKSRDSCTFNPRNWCVMHSCCYDISNSMSSCHLVSFLFLSISMAEFPSLTRGTSWLILNLRVALHEHNFDQFFRIRIFFYLSTNDLKSFYARNFRNCCSLARIAQDTRLSEEIIEMVSKVTSQFSHSIFRLHCESFQFEQS